MKHPVCLSSVGVAALAVLLAGCGHEPASVPAEQLPTATVSVTSVELKPRVATEEVVGTVRAKLRAVIEAKVSGRIENVAVVPGTTVRAGELLVQLSAPEIQARLDQAQAVRQQAESDLKRFTALLETGTLTRAEFDNAQARARVAQAAVVEAETLLGYTRILAPFNGIITRKHVDVGDLAAPGKPLLEMEDARTLRLEADVPEAVVGKVSLGDKLSVRIAAIEAQFQGTVSEIAPTADPVSRTFLVKLDLPPTPGLRAGQFGRVAMPVGETSALRVPASAVLRRGQMERTFEVTNGHAQLRLVKTGKHFANEVELISGVDAGERVVTDSVSELVDGQPVTVR